jgi:hypothetical protein
MARAWTGSSTDGRWTSPRAASGSKSVSLSKNTRMYRCNARRWNFRGRHRSAAAPAAGRSTSWVSNSAAVFSGTPAQNSLNRVVGNGTNPAGYYLANLGEEVTWPIASRILSPTMSSDGRAKARLCEPKDGRSEEKCRRHPLLFPVSTIP